MVYIVVEIQAENSGVRRQTKRVACNLSRDIMALTIGASPSPAPAPVVDPVAQRQSEYSVIQDQAAVITAKFDEAVRVRDFNLALMWLDVMTQQSDLVFQPFLLGSFRWPALLTAAGEVEGAVDDEMAEFIERAGAVLLTRATMRASPGQVDRYALEFDEHIASAEYEDALVALGRILRQNHSSVTEFITTDKRWNTLADLDDVDFLHAVADLVYWRFPPAGFYLGFLFFDEWSPPVLHA